jgi:hypothetical protein
MFSREAAITNFIFLGMIRPEIEPTIYHSGEHANIPWYDSTRDRTHDLPHSGEHANIPWYDSTRDRTHDLPHSGEHANPYTRYSKYIRYEMS